MENRDESFEPALEPDVMKSLDGAIGPRAALEEHVLAQLRRKGVFGLQSSGVSEACRRKMRLGWIAGRRNARIGWIAAAATAGIAFFGGVRVGESRVTQEGYAANRLTAEASQSDIARSARAAAAEYVKAIALLRPDDPTFREVALASQSQLLWY